MAAQRAKPRKTVRGRGVRPKRGAQLPFGRINYLLFALGIAIILVGFVALAQGPADSFWSLTVAPILLVIGYLILIPAAILYRDPRTRQTQGSA